MDAIEKTRCFNSFDLTKHRHLAEYQRFVTSLGIPSFEFYIGKSTRQLKCRTLTGPEKLKLFKNISISTLLPTLPPTDTSRIQHLWDELLRLKNIFSKQPEELSQVDIDAFEDGARQWGHNYVDVYHDRNVTPYIHAMANHFDEFLQLHGSLLPFTQQGLEKYNDLVTKQYFRASNHKTVQAFHQIMEKQNRLEHLHDIGAHTSKALTMTCTNCKEAGHTKYTCQQSCKTCARVPFYEHIIQVDGHFVPVCETIH